MAAREGYHSKQWIEDGEEHDCWTITEAALTQELSDDLRDAWERLRETAVSFGDQRNYASHKSIMFSRNSCYFFVRPKRNFLELNGFLGLGCRMKTYQFYPTMVQPSRPMQETAMCFSRSVWIRLYYGTMISPVFPSNAFLLKGNLTT